ncbi:MAG TPA: Fe-S cluster assembly protein SufD [Casimicrobiaceae bacterium]
MSIAAAAPSADPRSRYRRELEALEPSLPGRTLPWLAQARRRALERFDALGFPTTRDEDWKYTRVTALEKRVLKPAPPSAVVVNAAQLGGLALHGSRRLVFVNGRFEAALSDLDGLPGGARIGSLAAALVEDGERLEPLLSDAEEAIDNGFAALNAAFWADGGYIDLGTGTTLEAPIHLLFITTETDAVTYPRTLVYAGAGSRASIIEHHVGIGEVASFTNALTRIVVEPGAQVEHCKLQQEAPRAFHIAAIDVRQRADSRFVSCSFALGAALSRTGIRTRLEAPGCEATLNGLYVVAGRQHVDHHTCIDHAKPHGVSREWYRGVLDGAARAVFNGRVIVRPDAQKTDAHQSNRNLLLSDEAEVDTKPQLEIYADDVKCSHGATVGALDEQQLFYLRSRGVDERAARDVLIFAFADEIVGRCGIAPLRERMRALLAARLPGAVAASATETWL